MMQMIARRSQDGAQTKLRKMVRHNQRHVEERGLSMAARETVHTSVGLVRLTRVDKGDAKCLGC